MLHKQRNAPDISPDPLKADSGGKPRSHAAPRMKPRLPIKGEGEIADRKSQRGIYRLLVDPGKIRGGPPGPRGRVSSPHYLLKGVEMGPQKNQPPQRMLGGIYSMRTRRSLQG